MQHWTISRQTILCFAELVANSYVFIRSV